MEPNESAPIEQAPIPKTERAEDPANQTPEQAPPSQERLTPSGDRSAQGGPPPAILPTPQLAQPPSMAGGSPQSQTSDPTQAGGPAIADDVDVIEKEWVDKAKTIVSTHKHDPYNQEKEASKLQADYLKKRYGKEVKLAE